MNPMTKTQSKDGTPIAFEKSGKGPAVVLVDGALCYREFGPSRGLARLLSDKYTVYIYDRRGRGNSGDTAPYSIDREVEDLEAVIKESGGTASVYGISSGAALALEAALRSPSIEKLALYEAPFIIDDTRTPLPDDYLENLNRLITIGNRSGAVKQFMKAVQVPAFIIALMPMMPAWKKLKAVAHTLPYDMAFVFDYQKGKPLPPERWNSLKIPVMVMGGSKSPAWMRNSVRSLAGIIPGAQLLMLDGQTHAVKPEALAPELLKFFAG